MVVNRPTFEAGSQDTVVVVHHHENFDLAIVHTRLQVSGDEGITELVERIKVRPSDGVYRLELSVPEPDLVKGAPWHVTVLLPGGARYAGDDAEVDRRTPSNENSREVLAWTGEQDPLIPVVWEFVTP